MPAGLSQTDKSIGCSYAICQRDGAIRRHPDSVKAIRALVAHTGLVKEIRSIDCQPDSVKTNQEKKREAPAWGTVTQNLYFGRLSRRIRRRRGTSLGYSHRRSVLWEVSEQVRSQEETILSRRFSNVLGRFQQPAGAFYSSVLGSFRQPVGAFLSEELKGSHLDSNLELRR